MTEKTKSKYTEAAEAISEEDEHAPRVLLFVEGEKVDDQILADVKSVTYENSLYLTDELKIELVNEEGKYTDAVMWGHGNEVEAWFGYGQQMYYIGRAELVRHMPTFPSDGIMTLVLRGLDKSWRMKKEPPRITGGRQPRRRSEIKSQWEGPLSSYLKQVAKKYGFKHDISKKFDKIGEKFIQKRGQTDFQVVQALANYYYASFRVEYRIESKPRTGAWYLVFQDLDETRQQVHYNFRFKQGELSTILGVSFEFGISETVTEVKAYYWDPNWKEPDTYKTRKLSPKQRAINQAFSISAAGIAGAIEGGGPDERRLVRRGRRTGSWREVSVSDYKKEYKDVPVITEKARESGSVSQNFGAGLIVGAVEAAGIEVKTKKRLKKDHDPFARAYKSQRARIKEAPTPTRLRLVVGGHSIEIQSRPFKNAEDARNFILNWIKENQNNFITAKGTLPGIVVKAGETHALQGAELGQRFSGEYYFTNATQKYDDGGWITEFSARKVLTPEWLKRQREANKGLLEQPER